MIQVWLQKLSFWTWLDVHERRRGWAEANNVIITGNQKVRNKSALCASASVRIFIKVRLAFWPRSLPPWHIVTLSFQEAPRWSVLTPQKRRSGRHTMQSPLRFTATDSLAAHASTACIPEVDQSGGSSVVAFVWAMWKNACGVCSFQTRLVSPSNGSGRDHASSQLRCVSVIFTAMSVSGAQIVISLNVQTCHSD